MPFPKLLTTYTLTITETNSRFWN